MNLKALDTTFDYRLTNEERLYFGLDSLDITWDEVAINDEMTLFYEGDCIRKIISWNSIEMRYSESDVELYTNNRQSILPKTARGKEKKITPSYLLRLSFSGVCMSYGLKVLERESYIYTENCKNQIRLPAVKIKGITSIAEFKAWLIWYMASCPVDYFDKVDRMKNLPHRTIKYQVGDVFRYDIDREHYGYGIIIGKIADLIKKDIFPAQHPMLSTMAMPILIRIYVVKTKNPQMTFEELEACELIEADLMSDAPILWGTHEIIGNKPLKEADIDFPIQIKHVTYEDRPQSLGFAWGPAMKVVDKPKQMPEDIDIDDFRNDGVSLGLPWHRFENILEGKPPYYFYELNYPDNEEKKKKVFELFGLDPHIDFDTFNQTYGGKNRNDYVQFIAKLKKPIKTC